MFKSSMLLVFLGSLFFFAQAIIAAPVENPSDIPDDLLHYALHAVFPLFKDGVFTSNKQALEFLERENEALASSVYALVKRQATGNSTSSASSGSSGSSGSSTSSASSGSSPTTSSSSPPTTSNTPTTSSASSIPSTTSSPASSTSTPPSPTTTTSPPQTTTQTPTTPQTEPTTPFVTTSTSSFQTVITTNGQRSTITTVAVVVQTITPSHGGTNSGVQTSTFTPQLQSSAVKLPPFSFSTICYLLAVNVCIGLLSVYL